MANLPRLQHAQEAHGCVGLLWLQLDLEEAQRTHAVSDGLDAPWLGRRTAALLRLSLPASPMRSGP